MTPRLPIAPLLLALSAACVAPEPRHTSVFESTPEAPVSELDEIELEPPAPPPLPPKPAEEPYKYVLPYPTLDLMSDFWECRRRGRRHAALDIYGDGDDAGLGTPVLAVGTARVTFIGQPSQDPSQFGRPLHSRGTTRRGGRRLPASAVVDGYGRVYFFTRSRGSWRSGTVVAIELLEGPLRGSTVRYLHLGAVRPGLQVGDAIKPGTELGLLGGTAVQDSPPHLHVDAEGPDGERFDLAAALGVPTRYKRDISDC